LSTHANLAACGDGCLCNQAQLYAAIATVGRPARLTLE
jgi:hypothetical protein